MNTTGSATVSGNGTTATSEQKLEMAPLTPMRNIVLTGEAEFETVLPGATPPGATGMCLCRIEQPMTRSERIETKPVKSPFVKIIAMGPGWQTDYAVGDRVTYSQVMALSDELTKGGVEWATNFVWLHENKILGRIPRGPEDKGVTLRLASAGLRLSELDDESREMGYAAFKVWADLGQKFGFNPYDPNYVLGGPNGAYPVPKK
jgi:hypothetical protein